MKILILANGPFPPKYFLDHLDRADLLIAVDGGANHAFKLGIQNEIDLLIGDFDGILEENLEKLSKISKVEKHPRDKDKTDLELALQKAESFGAKEIEVFSWADERIDYAFDGLYSAANLNIQTKFFNHHSIVTILNSAHSKFELKRLGSKLSIYPLTNDVVLESSGLKWEVRWENASIQTRSQSNEILKNGFIHCRKGAVFILEEI